MSSGTQDTHTCRKEAYGVRMVDVADGWMGGWMGKRGGMGTVHLRGE